MEALGAKPEDCLFVGDSAADMEAGRRAGVKTCAVLYGYGNAEGHGAMESGLLDFAPCANCSALPESFAHPEHVPIGVPHMHFAHSPWHIGWRPDDLDPLRNAVPVKFIHIVQPH